MGCDQNVHIVNISDNFVIIKYRDMGINERGYNEKQRKIAAGIAIKRKGRPPKDYQVSEEDKVAQLRYIIDRKDARIKSLEMENELMRDFLSLIGRK